ncbi:MAG TPA: hypothetical protein VH255_05335 [Verrucomicrobiae bacterium]|jgi:hypothetical protein|nr:hypothetical protein [Verrucomicrobiae bacterium]
MNAKKLFQATKITFALCAALMGTVTGCVSGGYVQGGVTVQDDYVYYPQYEVYYSNTRHQYAYREGNSWVSRPAPRGVDVNVLVKSPSVKMDFHDAPANHHATVAKQYPKTWQPSGNENRNDDHKENNGR